MNQSLQNASHVERMDHLYKVISSKRFLEKQGLGNEVPFFICPYKANEAVEIERATKQLVKHVTDPIPRRPGQPEIIDYEYERNGTGNLFMPTW